MVLQETDRAEETLACEGFGSLDFLKLVVSRVSGVGGPAIGKNESGVVSLNVPDRPDPDAFRLRIYFSLDWPGR